MTGKLTKGAKMRREKRNSGKVVHCPSTSAKSPMEEPGKSVGPVTHRSKSLFEKSRFDADDLIAAITPANRHDEICFGRPVGRELL